MSSTISSPDYLTLGQLILDPEGVILQSSGDLENDEHSGRTLARLVSALPPTGQTQRLSLHYTDHSYVLTLFRTQIHVRKVTRQPNAIDQGLD